ncbi:MAG: 50S ribosomal protein L17 [Candidatus Harrisonbacteria bacterium RIFOXYA1_FULL_48_8]|uniref:50S ribosomal protein L17 n=3 Tax=Parcubacteria group TaxID=1794811 RepID=A0A0G1T626_9BACT|nr:MAG: 50S ribosomal protein L17 [Candidatus Giovannonibacteria bacterium GW2011_GWB1_47_6b]KKU92219.1 MAG: 50S ribosomal protein L17 [Parcubacteria group bacterium GW2011_GWA1_48_11b]OGY64046.1 MAG: 50S ribosomal protein L17 [Candidatus Harrisonbacteria bacterium RIFCSPHIGHO2_12_FULL_48_16]OGY69211.1 MAG: 50S ribosomal protein L17 [Candidatus Harrisonbacteria bacterium RIFOXYA1_FULL_48_8]
MRKFHRTAGPRRSFVKGLANNLIMKEKMETTISRAKEIRPVVEHLVTLAKKQQLAAFRILLSRLPKQAAQKLYYDIAPRYKTRAGGYLRIIKEAKSRKRDATPLAIIEFVK